MITLLDFITYLLLPIFGMAFGWSLGAMYFNWPAGFGGAAIGVTIFWFGGGALRRFFLAKTVRKMRERFARLSSEELRAHLATSLTPNFILLELKARGQDVAGELDVVLALLEDSNFHRRVRGWAALSSAFPDVAASLKDFRIHASGTDREAALSNLRNNLQPH
jgi:hypothetical protein